MQFYQQDIEDVFTNLGTKRQGLSQAEAQKRLLVDGLNQLDTQKKVNHGQILLAQFQSFLIYILFFAVGLSLLVGEYTESLLILGILIANALIGYYQELNALKSIQALQSLHIHTCQVWRDGQLQSIEAQELVRGDIISVSAGDKIPADCRLIEVQQLKVEEANLTGESLPITKHNKAIADKCLLAEQKNMLFASTMVLEGNAQAVVVQTGMQTEIGKIAQMMIDTDKNKTPLQQKLEVFGKKIGYLVLSICLCLLIVQSYYDTTTQGISWQAFIKFLFVAIALAVAAVPEGLPVVITICLSIGVQKMLRKKVLVRTLASVETLGSCDVICTDKTGTLTQNQMTVQKIWTWQGETTLKGVGYTISPKHYFEPLPNEKWLLHIGFFCNNASVQQQDGAWQIVGSPTEAAFCVSAKKAQIKDTDFIRISEKPFDSNRKKMSVLVATSNEQDKKYFVFVKGAADKMIEACTHFLDKDQEVKPLTSTQKEQVATQIEAYATEAMRILAFAYKPLDFEEAQHQHTTTYEENLIFVGLQALIDPPRPDVPQAITQTRQAGIRVIMMTGDHKATAEAVAKMIGMQGKTLTGANIDALSEEALMQVLAQDYHIFARVVPQHKQRIVTALQNMGHIVAMTGDGVNDAPALKKADIGVAIGNGTEVAKEAADMILLDNSFSHIAQAIEEGRGIYDNIQKVILNSLTINLAEVLTIFVAVVAAWQLPFMAVTLLLMNLVIDSIPALALALDRYSPTIMQRMPKSKDTQILALPELRLLLSMALLATGFMLYFFYAQGGATNQSSTLARSYAFVCLVAVSIVFTFVIRAYYGIPLFSNISLWGLVLFKLLLAWVIVYDPTLQTIFGLQALGFEHITQILVGISLLALLSYAVMKVLRRFANSGL